MKRQKGDILHCHGEGWVAKCIGFFTGSYITHTALMYDDDHVIESNFSSKNHINGVNVLPFDEWQKIYGYKFKVSRPDRFTASMFEKAKSKINVKYDFQSTFVMQPLHIITNLWLGATNQRAQKRFYCSEFVAWVYGLPNWEQITPADVYKICLKSPRFTQL